MIFLSLPPPWIGGDLGKLLKFSTLPCLFWILSMFALFLFFVWASLLLPLPSAPVSAFSLPLASCTLLHSQMWQSPRKYCMLCSECWQQRTCCLLVEVSAPNDQDLNKFLFLIPSWSDERWLYCADHQVTGCALC